MIVSKSAQTLLRATSSLPATALSSHASKIARALYSSLSDAAVYPRTDTHFDEHDARSFGYRVANSVDSRSYLTAMTSFYEEDYHVMRAGRRPMELIQTVPGIDTSSSLCLNEALLDSLNICEIIAAQAEWDELILNDYTRPHFEMLKEDPYVEEIEDADEVLQDLHDHDIVKPMH
jgi:hypothetical protein